MLFSNLDNVFLSTLLAVLVLYTKRPLLNEAWKIAALQYPNHLLFTEEKGHIAVKIEAENQYSSVL